MRNEKTPRGLLNEELAAVEWSERDTLAVLRAAEQGGRKSMKFTMKLALTMVVVTMLMASTALALVNYGLEWYYGNRAVTVKEQQPEKYAAIMNNLQSEIVQHAQEDPEVRVTVVETAWVQEQNILVVSVAASAVDNAAYELHPMWNLDADGAYVGEGGSENPASDGEDRAVHWLWTSGGFGPVEQMVAPGKKLMLIDMQNLYMDDMILRAGIDTYVTEDGSVHAVLECRLDEQQMESLMTAAGEGAVTLTLPYTITHYSEEDELLYGNGRVGEICFEVKTR